ncbi:MAG: cytidylyltransferase domain-containing protein [Salibacteraceae bacterium]
MNILITICARGGSKGIPGKNIKLLNNKPVIAYTIEIAKRFAAEHNAFIGLSTDSEEIIAVAKKHGLETTYTRPDELANDTAGKAGAIKHLKEFEENRQNLRFDYIMDLDVTAPMRTLDDLNQAFEMLKSKPEAYNIFSANPAARNPYFNMVEDAENGYVKLVKDAGTILSRQSAPKVYDMNASFYIFRKSFFNENQKTSTTNKSLVFEMSHLCFDLDEPIDFLFMEYLFSNNLLDFEL